MLKVIYRLRDFFREEVYYIRVLFALATSYFFLLALTGDTIINGATVHDSYARYVEGTAAFTGLLFCLSPFGKRYCLQATYAFIYVLNFANLWLIYEGKLYDNFCYEFTLFYVLCNFYFRKKEPHLFFNAIISLLFLAVVIATPHDYNGNPAKFFITFAVVYCAMYLIIGFRYILADELAESESRYKQLAKNSDDIICLHDFSGRILYISPAVRKMLGYEPEECIGKMPLDFIHPDDKEKFKKFTAEYFINQNNVDRILCRVKNKFSDYNWVETLMLVIDDPKTEGLQIMSTTRDFSIHRLTEMKLS